MYGLAKMSGMIMVLPITFLLAMMQKILPQQSMVLALAFSIFSPAGCLLI
jgi:glycopeptide antibiotics resistance protein